MMTRRLASSLSLALALSFTAAACVRDDAGDAGLDEGQITSAIELDNGGLDTADEAPEFGDEALFTAASLEADAAATDALDADPELRAMRERPDVAARRVLVAWGQLPPDRSRDAIKTWSGDLALSRGGMLVRRTVGFEERTDAVAARTSRASVSFTSVTKPFADGLLLSVYDPDPASAEPLVLGYDGAAGSYRLDLADLAAGPIVIDVDADGNKLIAMSLQERPATDPCAHGFMRGRWHALRMGLGAYLGVVSDGAGAPIGHVRGMWGVRRSGEQVMFGKFISRDGAFTGLIAGHYRDGEFVARWINRAGDAGRIHGAYRQGADGGPVGGGFVARWAETTCAQELPLDR